MEVVASAGAAGDLGGERFMDEFDYIFTSAKEGYATFNPAAW